MNLSPNASPLQKRESNVLLFLLRVFNKFSVGQKIMTVIVVEILSYSIITTTALYQIHVMGNEIKQMANLYMPLLSAVSSIKQQVLEERLHFKDIVVSGDRVVYDKEAEDAYQEARSRYREANNEINTLIQDSERMVRGTVADGNDAAVIKPFAPLLLKQLAAIRESEVRTTDQINMIFSHVEDGSFLMGMELVDSATVSEQTLMTELDQLESQVHDLKAASVQYAVAAERSSSRMTLLASLTTVCVVILIFFVMVKKNISRPLHTLTDAIKKFDFLGQPASTFGEIEQARLLSRGDELGMVARSLFDLKQTLSSQGQALHSAKEAAERADSAKTRFLAAASHDLRQPLHAMQMYIAALQQRIHDRGTLAIVDDIQAVSFATGRLLNSLLDVSQLEAGAVKPQLESFPLQELLDKVAISFMPLAKKNGLTLSVCRTDRFVHSDPALMERILANFVSNAIRYTKAGGILLGARPRGNDLAVQVWDTGCGIPEDQIAAIFEDFHQLQNDERDRSKGLGLGLAIVRRLAECLDHRIQVASKVGRGSCFGVLCSPGDPSAWQIARQERVQFVNLIQDLSGLNVMLIEDDKVVSEATMLLLRSWRCNVGWVRTTEEALDHVENNRFIPHIVLADYRLPGRLDGVEAIQRIQFALQRPVPGIIITGESDISAIRNIERMGFVILRKPVRPAKLRRLIANGVGRTSSAHSDVA